MSTELIDQPLLVNESLSFAIGMWHSFSIPAYLSSAKLLILICIKYKHGDVESMQTNNINT